MVTTTDTDALQERIAEELYYDRHPEGRHRGEWPAAVYPDDVYEYRDLAATVLPIIAAEVRKAQADALREAAHEFAEGAWADQWGADRVDDDVSAVQSTERWFNARANDIEQED